MLDPKQKLKGLCDWFSESLSHTLHKKRRCRLAEAFSVLGPDAQYSDDPSAHPSTTFRIRCGELLFASLRTLKRPSAIDCRGSLAPFKALNWNQKV
jgi:hypothetical protein